ncbi:MAG: carboxylate--amine ligase [Bifidobacteriaceae bacterium]|nr:carboxylate--amine ligase [Bifidobacteriaceae bacterium]
MTKFEPVLLGSDINAYGMARAFHQAYNGLQSTAFAAKQLSPTKFSSIINIHLVENFSTEEQFAPTLVAYAQHRKLQEPDTMLLLIPCGDVYANLLSHNREVLAPYYAFNTLDPALNKRLSYKNTFYELCEQYNLPHPKTFVVTKEDVQAKTYEHLPFPFPVAMKPVDSAQWLHIDFPGRKKAFIIQTPQELDTLIQRSYAAGYTAQMVIQDFIPGDDSHMRVLNAYVDKHHRVRMMMLGHPLLEDPSPEAIGNYSAILPDYNQTVFQRIKAFLEDIQYEGVANFDMKFDERDGEYKLFEINLRQGRSSYFVTLNGENLAQYFVNDLVEDTPFDGNTTFAKGNKLWLEIPKSVFKKYAINNEYKQQALQLIRDNNYGSTLYYKKDMNFKRWLMHTHLYNYYKKSYAKYFHQKAE